MLGNPKYHINQMVKFKVGNYELVGKIEIIDRWGTFEQHEEVCYDILVERSPHYYNKPSLYKHIKESMVVECLSD